MTGSKNTVLLTWIIAGFLCIGSAKAQPSTFIHIQSESKQAYQIQWKGNTYYSSAKGNLVIPLVPVGEHIWVLGFPGNILPECSFAIAITDRPRGFTLKMGIDNTWTLFDMASFEVITSSVVQKEVKAASAADKPVEIEKEALKEVVLPLIIEKPAVEASVKKEKPVIRKSKNFQSYGIQKIFEIFNDAGIDQVYIISNKGKTDTVAIFIPVVK
ncbi:MAG: hypothetical protein M0Q26_13070 [Chitinophagaceae bacterium]|nr:hypothetical protein [Chitinophagaceae bacterium]